MRGFNHFERRNTTLTTRVEQMHREVGEITQKEDQHKMILQEFEGSLVGLQKYIPEPDIISLPEKKSLLYFYLRIMLCVRLYYSEKSGKRMGYLI